MVIFTDISPFGPVDFQELATSNCEFQARMPGQSGEGSKHQRKVSVITSENEAKAPLVRSSTELNRRGA